MNPLKQVLMVSCMTLIWSATVTAQHNDPVFHHIDDPLNHWLGLDQAADGGVHASTRITTVFQQNAHGGLGSHRQAGRYTGSYELDLFFDLEQLWGWSGGEFLVITEGGLSSGLSENGIGSLSEVNSDAMGDYPAVVTEAYWSQHLFDDKLILRAGKLDLKCYSVLHDCQAAFDGNHYANQETDEFFNSVLYSNSTIPYPENGLGAIVIIDPQPGFYLATGLADAQSHETQTGFNTAFHQEADFLYLNEVGVSPHLLFDDGLLRGTYRVGIWYNPEHQERLDRSGSKSDDCGFYASCDQMVFKENQDADDVQGLGLFGRIGLADETVNAVGTFWSLGCSYQGALPGRDSDVWGLGFAQNIVSSQPQSGFSENNENIWEMYYQWMVHEYIDLTADIQYITDPGATGLSDDALILGMRINITL